LRSKGKVSPAHKYEHGNHKRVHLEQDQVF
jgi:hypothetical protein